MGLKGGTLRDSGVLLKNGRFAIIKEMTNNGFKAKILIEKHAFVSKPMDSTELGINKFGKIGRALMEFPNSEIDKKCMIAKVNGGYISLPLLH